MEELTEACPKACSVSLDIYGLRVGVRTNESAILEELPSHLPIGWKRLSAGRVERWYGLHDRSVGTSKLPRRFELEEGGRQLAQSESLSEAWQRFEYELELDVAEHSPDYVFLHAGVVGWQGQAILIPGPSFSGKSTLVAALCQAGAIYYSDEYALLDRHGLVHAYPRPLRLRQPIPNVAATIRPDQPSPDGQLPLPVGLVVLTQHQPGVVWQPKRISSGEAILALLHHALSVQRQPPVVLAVLGRALDRASLLRGPRGEAMETAERVLRWAALDCKGA